MRGQIAVKNYSADEGGYITVRGRRVKGGSNQPVKFKSTCSVHCQRCKNLNIICKTGVFMRFEMAFNSPFYWCEVVGSIPSFCDGCAPLMNH